MFPGQGSQYIGMGKEFYEQIPICKEVYDLASEVTGLDIPALQFIWHWNRTVISRMSQPD